MGKIFGTTKTKRQTPIVTKQNQTQIPKPEEISKIPVHNIETKNWIEEEEEEGELLVDVYQNDGNIIIRSTVAGVKPEDLDIDLNNDMITIRGKRKGVDTINEDDFFYQECYWGSFSRSIILPCEVQAGKVKASLKDGILTIVLPKSEKDKAVKISVDQR